MTDSIQEVVVKPKRGRRTKKEILASLEEKKNKEAENNSQNSENNIKLHICGDTNMIDNLEVTSPSQNENENCLELETENIVVKPIGKKRGRKPKGGKIIQQDLSNTEVKETKPNIILHLKCSVKDIQLTGDYNSNFTTANIESFTFSGSKNECFYEIINKPNEETNIQNHPRDRNPDTNEFNKKQEEDNCETKEIWRKLKILEHDLHINNISDKKSACFWCSYDFDNPPIYIPKHYIKDSYHVYGCFCSPECATSYLMDENIDSSTKFERYYLLNHIYSKIYQYSKNIKPAPNPHYMLERFYGNLTIQEYRLLLKSERLFLMVDKPLTRILPEFHEDNDDFIINNKIIPSNNYQLKKRLQKKQQSKSTIMNEQFGLLA
jgi:hypothetical protein